MPIKYIVGRRIGYRCLALAMFGSMFLAIGVGTLINPMPDPYLFHTHLPLWFRFAVWGGAGLAAIGSAFLPRWQYAGFGALFIGPFERFISFSVAMAAEPSLARLTGTALYLLLSMTVVLLASWPEPTRVPTQRAT